MTTPNTSSVSNSVLFRRKEENADIAENAEDVPAPAEDIPAPAPAPTLEIVQK